MILLKDNEESAIRKNPKLKTYNPQKLRLLSDIQKLLPNTFRRFLEAEVASIETKDALTRSTTTSTVSASVNSTKDAQEKEIGAPKKEGSSAGVAIGVPRKEGSSEGEAIGAPKKEGFSDIEGAKVTAVSVEPRPKKDNDKTITVTRTEVEQPKTDLPLAGPAAFPIKVVSSDNVPLPPIIISDDPGRWPSQATTVCDALLENARVTETLSKG